MSKPHSMSDYVRQVVYEAGDPEQMPLHEKRVVDIAQAYLELEEQLETTQAVLRGVIEHVEELFQGGTFVDPVFVLARKVLDGSTPAKGHPMLGVSEMHTDSFQDRNSDEA